MTATSEQELLLIGETWAPAIAGSVRDVLDPASGEVIAQVADASRADVDAAVSRPAAGGASSATRPSTRSPKPRPFSSGSADPVFST
jgi:acyl-CoA reductase-like NAD-dependent aldehyde dehydrogenase